MNNTVDIVKKYLNFRRDVNGILLLNKPKGISSNGFLQKLKIIFCAKKAGYIGTLDPLATGMLPICFGKANKFVSYLTNADKRYRVKAFLGQSTNTFDAEGKITSIKPVIFNKNNLEDVLNLFRGEMDQIPPMFSALKYKGIPLYKYANKGINIYRQPRKISIYSLKLINWSANKLELEIHCSKGTYIRVIINDIGEKLGCGAYVQSLHRLSVAHFSEESMIQFDEIKRIVSENISLLESKTIFSKIDQLLLPYEQLRRNIL
ncbi:tRNA pseudouridine(55) synthase TruB [Candidatus Schneideria nysicola]|uniref:tRNA pseudouridine(55) synthase TruB n=1 Tax=Candidatus Schneideria nysicola TaxID=1081631 RepID=UPI001CAA79A7|nr:tRNA pseudouridine(55) synthase TruB [Candidatus Schneideria nysicola]UAJ65362.1 tRNA pseudouridine(55) synthase TruB [Candidatus Schneideria nysicola]UAJ65894.1 tRNA pseudouridine(55) synthase TruB [Candidatus Schneideria nysicola]